MRNHARVVRPNRCMAPTTQIAPTTCITSRETLAARSFGTTRKGPGIMLKKKSTLSTRKIVHALVGANLISAAKTAAPTIAKITDM